MILQEKTTTDCYPLKKFERSYAETRSNENHEIHLGKEQYVIKSSQLKALSAFAIQFGITGAAKVIVIQTRNQKAVPIPNKMMTYSDFGIEFLKKLILLACEYNINEIESLLSQSLIGTFENDVRQRLALASLKTVYKETKSWTRVIQNQGVESKADKHARTGDLIQAYLADVYSGGEVYEKTANIGGFEALQNFKFISHIDIIRDAPEGIQFRLLRNPILFPANYDSKTVASYKTAELRRIISIVRDSRVKQNELFKNIKKIDKSKIKKDDDSDNLDTNTEEQDECTDEFSDEAGQLLNFEKNLLAVKSMYLALKENMSLVQNTKFKKGW